MGKKSKMEPAVLVDYLAALEDPRVDRTKKHELIDILIISICAGICGAKTWVDIEDFGEAKLTWFKSFLNLKHGIPSHDTFRRLFLLLDFDKFAEIFCEWVKAVTAGTDLQQICIDGKTLRRSFDNGKKSSAIHMINAWSTGVSLSLGQMKSEGKSNEIKTVPKLIDTLNIKGCIVSADAMNCQKKTAEKIVEKEADYLLAAKGNQEYLEDRLKEEFTSLKKPGPKSVNVDVFTSEDDEHGRLEKRECRVISAKEGKNLAVNPLNKWPKLTSLIEVVRERVDKKTGVVSGETHYYISSYLGSAEEMLTAVRRHWEVENKLHWVLDVVFREDDCRNRVGHCAENFSLLRLFCLNLIKQDARKIAIRRKQNIAGWDEEYLLSLLLGYGKLDA